MTSLLLTFPLSLPPRRLLVPSSSRPLVHLPGPASSLRVHSSISLQLLDREHRKEVLCEPIRELREQARIQSFHLGDIGVREMGELPSLELPHEVDVPASEGADFRMRGAC